MNSATVIPIILGTVSYIVWAVMAYFDPTQRADFLKLNVVIVSGTIGLKLRDMQSPPPPPPPVPFLPNAAPTTIVKE